MLGFAPNSISCISFYNIFYVSHTGDWTWSMLLGEVCSRDLPHLAISSSTQTTRHIFQKHIQLSGSGAGHKKLLDVASMARLARKLGGWTPQNYSMLFHMKNGGKKNSTPWAATFGSLIPNLGIWIQGSGAAGYESLMADFSNSWKINTRILKTDLTLSLILRFNLRLGGNSIWSASSSRTI